MTDNKASGIEAEIEQMRHSRIFVGLDDKLTKYRRKFAPSGSRNILLTTALEHLVKAEIIMTDTWMLDDDIQFDHWIPTPTTDKSMLQALPLLKKAQMSKEKTDIDTMASKVKKFDV
jgi:hypothetical protein